MSLRLQGFASGKGRDLVQLLLGRRKYPRTSHLRFPIEIWDIIFEFLSKFDVPLFPLLRIHPALFPGVERVLYRHVNLSGDLLRHITRRIRIFQRLADHPHIARLVASFALPPLIASDTTNFSYEDVAIYYATFQSALRSMTHLRSLNIAHFSTTQPSAGTLPHLDELFYGCKFRLFQLRIGYFTPGKTIVMEGCQHSITELALDAAYGRDFSANAFPNLRILEVISFMGYTPSLLQGNVRSIRAFRLSTRAPQLEGGPFPGIKSVRLSVVAVIFSRVSAAFPSLCYLRLDFEIYPVSTTSVCVYGGLV